jgi:hypothetical protein
MTGSGEVANKEQTWPQPQPQPTQLDHPLIWAVSKMMMQAWIDSCSGGGID